MIQDYIFDYCVSNPPYQEATTRNADGRLHSTPIYDDFHRIMYPQATNIIMIYPSTWQRDLQKGHGEWLIAHGLHRTYDYDGQDVFSDSIRKDYPVSIVETQCGYNGIMYSQDSFRNTRGATYWLNHEAIDVLVNRTKDFPKLDLGTVRTNVRIKNVLQVESLGYTLCEDKDSLCDPVSIYIKKTAGTIPNGTWYYMNRSQASKLYGCGVEKYKVALRTRFFVQNQAVNELLNNPDACFAVQVFDRDQIFGQTLTLLSNWGTREEAENFAAYLNTRIITFLISATRRKKSFCELVPDLEDYTSNNTNIDWDQPLEEQLYKLFGLTQEEIRIVSTM